MMGTDMFENSKKIRNVKCPIIVIHGEKDDTIPISLAHKLTKSIEQNPANANSTTSPNNTSSNSLLWKFAEIANANHFNLDSEYGDDVLDVMLDFITHLTPKELVVEKEKARVALPST